MFSQFPNSRALKSKSIVKLLTAVIVGGMLLSSGAISAEELYYDDGGVNNYTGGSEGVIRAVRFTVTEPVAVTAVKFYGIGTIKIHIWDGNKDQVFLSENYSFTTLAWNTIDLSMKGIPALSGDFFAGVEFAASDCYLGRDTSSPDSRTYSADLTVPWTDHDIMIRVFVEPASQPDVTAPGVSNVMADDVVFGADAIATATATDDDSNIASAEYSRDGTPWTAMSAQDGAFDGEQSEDLTARLSGLVVKTHEVCVKATDTASPANTSDGKACVTFDVTAAQLDIAFAGQELDLDGAPTQLKAEVAGPCSSGAEVEFFVDGVSQGKATTDTLGVASLSTTLQMGVHDIKAEVDDQDLDGDSETECKGDSDAGVTVVADPNAASSGGGWYKVDGVTPPRVNFGYVANVKYNKKTQELVTTGNLLWMNQDNFKLKGVINESGKFDCPSSDYVSCAGFAGTGILYEHNDDYDPAIDPPSEEWAGNSPLEVSFEVRVYDGGSSTVCQKKRCTVTERPDAIMVQINGASVPAAPYEIITLQGGSITVKK